ncbi:MAG: translation initiation factor 2 [Spirochaetaceae bacterium]|nr:translation initiation factor 2 [Spirochaetaceae bacterium]
MELKLPYLLKNSNICYYDEQKLYIGNRKIFPFEKSFVICSNSEEISTAIKNMITQGGGPLQVALTSMCYLTSQMCNNILEYDFDTLCKNMQTIINSRPTNTTMKRVIEELLLKLKEVMIKSTPIQFRDYVIECVKEKEHEEDLVYHNMGLLGSSLLNDGDTILTTCFAEHTLILSIYYAIKEGKSIKVLANETRPYFQGSRLTAPSMKEMGIPVNIITDSMGAYFMRNGEVNHYMSASDLVCMDGTVVNKIGTLSNAIAAYYYGIPYTAFSMSPDKTKTDKNKIKMELRDGKEILNIFNHPISEEGIEALYPAFDIIDSKLVTNIVTNKGIFSPNKIKEYF